MEGPSALGTELFDMSGHGLSRRRRSRRADLLTLRAARLLAAADIVLHDALVHPDTLALAARARKVAVGKRCGAHSTAQRFINKRLVDAARKHDVVVRLKGGDPMLFGRAQEEIDALDAAGIAYEVVPGITAALAASAELGMSLTQRGVARSVAFVTPRVGDGRGGARTGPRRARRGHRRDLHGGGPGGGNRATLIARGRGRHAGRSRAGREPAEPSGVVAAARRARTSRAAGLGARAGPDRRGLRGARAARGAGARFGADFALALASLEDRSALFEQRGDALLRVLASRTCAIARALRASAAGRDPSRVAVERALGPAHRDRRAASRSRARARARAA